MIAPFPLEGAASTAPPSFDPWAAMRLGADAAAFLPLSPASWVELARVAGLQPVWTRSRLRDGSIRNGMFQRVPPDPDRRLHDFLVGWVNTRPRRDLRRITAYLRWEARRRGVEPPT